jgi:hypothetical protein
VLETKKKIKKKISSTKTLDRLSHDNKVCLSRVFVLEIFFFAEDKIPGHT